ncbi:MAG TPA: NAD(P)/FAD-dependent oxidoreductase [Candidatus Limnocylindrales bacterium]|nr:NAD(P)/FAD-dependent oxidoreductase [Candidatus Limnocylindrales bacterium]
MRTIYRSEPPWPHRILILGGGFAGVETARHLESLTRRRDDVEIWLVNRENFTLFTPLLPEVCSGMLEARHCVTALRAQLKRPSSWAITAEVEAIDVEGKVVTVLGGDGDLHRLHYDTLVMALGGETATFGIKGITEYAVGMKTLADAFALRNRVIEMLERADLETDEAHRRAQLTFVVGGAGFSGVETAGEIEDFVRRVRKRFYPKIPTDELRFHIVELKDRVLPEMPIEMGEYAARKLRDRGYEIHLGTPLQEVREDGVVIGEEQRFIPARTVMWTGGVQPSRVVREAGIDADRAGRALVQPTMQTSHPSVWAIGDNAMIPKADDEGFHAPTAQNAVREAKQLAKNILAAIDGRPHEIRPFRYRVIGTLASIGHHTGVGVVFGIRVRGLLAWLMWRSYYWSRVPGIGGKARVGLDWFLTALFGSDPVQLKVDYGDDGGMGPSGRRRARPRAVDPRA